MRKESKNYIIIFLLISMIISSCEAVIPGKTGNIKLAIIMNLDGAKTLLPPLDMTPARYSVTGSGQNGATFSESMTETTATITELSVGAWTITVQALNAASTVIGLGTATATVSQGTSTPVAVTVVPLSGNGILNINLSWPSDVITAPAVTASLTPIDGGDAIAPSANSVSGATASLSWNSVPAGYYSLSIQLKDGTTVVDGKTDIVRILKDQTTSGEYTWTAIKPRPFVTFIDDDGNSTVVSKLLPIALSKGIPFCVAMPSDFVGTRGHLTTNDLLNLQNLGWEIASHGKTHTALPALSENEIENELSISKSVLEGYGLQVNNFVYPYGQYNQRVCELVEQYYHCGITTNGNSRINYLPLNIARLDRVALGAYFDEPNKTFPITNTFIDYYKKMVDLAFANNGWLIFMLHSANISFGEAQQGYLNDTIDYIKSLGVRIGTIEDGLQYFTIFRK